MNDIKDCFGKNADSAMPTTDLSIGELAKKNGDYAVFSTPGHKGELNRYDLTEYDGGRIFPQNSVAQAEKKTAVRYGAKRAKYSVCGSSMAIKSAIVAVDGNIVAPVFTHRCVSEGATLIKKQIYFFSAGNDGSLPAVPTACDYEKALIEHPDTKLAVVTSPDYFGRCAKVADIKRVCERFGVLLLVDCAHGAHFASRRDLFPVGAEKIADFSSVSAHKTLRSLTQTAIGFCNNEQYFNAWEKAFDLLGTTSPSYELLSSIQNGIAYEDEHADYYDTLAQFRFTLNREFRGSIADNDDYMRIVLRSPDDNGETLFTKLVSRKIMPETYYQEYCVLILTLSDTREKLDALHTALKDIYYEKR